MSAWAKWSLVLLVALFLVACGTDEEEENANDGGDGSVEEGAEVTVTQSGITLLRSGSSLQTGLDQTLKVTARVRDEDGRLLTGAPIRFRILQDQGAQFAAADDTETSGNAFLTNDSGAASVLVSSSDPSNRTVDMVATVNGTESEPLSIPIEGTTVGVEAPSAGSAGQTIEVSATLTDSQGKPIVDEPLNFSSDGNGAFIDNTATTKTQGRATTEYNIGSSGGNVTLTAEAAGTAGVSTLNVASDVLVFNTPTKRPEIELSGSEPIEVKLTKNGNGISDQITFDSSRPASFTSNGVSTDSSTGIATTTLQPGSSAGPAKITATADTSDAIAQTEVLFVATDPDQLALQADPGTVAPGGEAQVKAVVRNSNDQRVKNADIRFSITDDTTGSDLSTTRATTDEFGRATTTFEAGDATSATEGVEITAEVMGTSPTVSSTVRVTVSGEALFITIGTGSTIRETGDGTRYEVPYSVLVTDASGGPVENADVTLEVIPTQFGKGSYSFSDPPGRWVQNRSATCTNEDTNRNGLKEPGEDKDNDGKLEPGNVATLSSQTVTTDDSGFASFNVRYPQDHAQWVTVRLSGQSEVAGTESKKSISFGLPVLSDDLSDENSDPPNVISPFGTVADCTDRN